MRPPRSAVTPAKTPLKSAKTPKRYASNKSDPVEVFCRIRPLEGSEAEACIKVLDPKLVSLAPPESTWASRRGEVKESQYGFAHVFDDAASQKSVFDHVALPLVDDLLNGKNALLFAYGVTCSGKTYTMTGNPHDQGILPRSLDVIFNSIGDLQAKKYVFKPDRMNGFDVQTEADAMMERHNNDVMPKMLSGTPKKTSSSTNDQFDIKDRVRDPTRIKGVDEDSSFAVFVSYVEIYNNYVYDLLEEPQFDTITGYKPPTSKLLREDSNHNMYVSAVSEVEIKSTEEAYDILIKGHRRRKVAHTALNTESSRSHSVFNIRLVQAPLDPLGAEVFQDKRNMVISQLSLVDLAGSERTVRTNNQGERLKEASSINQTLMVLRQCIEKLRENQKNFTNNMVPYRDSRLTHLFKNYFDGEGKVKMVVCVNPRGTEYDETLHVMRFAELTQEVQIARSEKVKVDIGLTPGRRKMNQRFKEAVARIQDGEEVPLPALVYNLGPALSTVSMQLHNPNDESVIGPLIKFLLDRDVKRTTLLTDFSKKQETFRMNLVKLEDENEQLRARLAEMETDLANRHTSVAKFERKIRELEKNNTALNKHTTAIESERRHLERELDQKEWQIQQTQNEKENMKKDYKAKLVFNEHALKQKMESRVREKAHKIEMLRNIINDSDTDSVSSGLTPRTTRSRAATMASSGGRVMPARSEPDLASAVTSSGSTPTTTPRSTNVPHYRAMTAAAATRRRSPPPVKPKPVVNPRLHRRSKSSHEVWLDHRPANTVETGTILQPQLKKKRSVTKLTDKDTQKATRYMLTHQDVDSEGEINTKYVKGNITRTSAGGHAVVFDDVEVLKQTSPGESTESASTDTSTTQTTQTTASRSCTTATTMDSSFRDLSRKRKSQPSAPPEDEDGDWTDVETRCRIGIEGHSGDAKRHKISQV